MKHLRSLPLALAVLALSAAPARAHYNMLLPDKASVKKGEQVTFTYQWGHPFEHELFDAPRPEKVSVLAPAGPETDLTESLEKVSVPAAEGKKVTAYRFRFTPRERGDYVVLLRTPPIWMKEEQEFLQDTVSVVLHVQAQKGWDAGLGDPYPHLVPLTRPYGLQPGMVFQAQLFKPHPERRRVLVEIERYNPTPPKELPPDEQITRTARTDPNAVVICTLTDPGWWAVTAVDVARGAVRPEGPVRIRATLWVFVDEKR
jgi:cobalt/nickel transport protein